MLFVGGVGVVCGRCGCCLCEVWVSFVGGVGVVCVRCGCCLCEVWVSFV